MAIFERITGWATGGSRPVKQMIGRMVYSSKAFWEARRYGRKSIDQTRPDYGFWDKLRRGKAMGFELAGLFCKPIVEILVAGVLGRDLVAELDTESDVEHTNTLLGRFMRQHRGTLITLIEDLYSLGDQYVVVNSDGSLSIPSPETVWVEYDEVDYRRMVRVTITTVLDSVTVTDVYTDEAREVSIHYHDQRQDPEPDVYPNLRGRIPVVHFANDRSGNEMHGRPIYEALYRLFSRYNDLLEKALDGAELMGNPIPALTGMEDTDEVFELNEIDEGEEYMDDDGNTVQRVRLAFDRLMMVILGKGGQFSFVSPNVGFTKDVRDMMKSLFLLILEFTRIPEAVWGGELGSARATAEQQMIPFYQYLEKRRTMLEGRGSDEMLDQQAQGGLLELLDLWLVTKALTDRRVTVAPVVIQWGDLYESAEEMRFKWASWLKGMSLITDETAVRVSRLVDDADGEVAAAREAAPQQTQDDFDQRLQDAVDDEQDGITQFREVA